LQQAKEQADLLAQQAKEQADMVAQEDLQVHNTCWQQIVVCEHCNVSLV
jgi:F0F1-type ATP synthase membrane subunit b/b'